MLLEREEELKENQVQTNEVQKEMMVSFLNYVHECHDCPQIMMLSRERRECCHTARTKFVMNSLLMMQYSDNEQRIQKMMESIKKM